MGRNDPCPCGSGKKFKLCCGRLPEPTAASEAHGAQPPPQEVPGVELESLVALIEAGHHADLEARSRGLLRAWPQSGLLWQLLGGALSAQGKDALQALESAARLRPEDAAAHFNLGNELARRGRPADAAACYARTLAVQPQFAQAHHNLGDMQLQLGRLTEAAASLQNALRIEPASADMHNSLGSALVRLGRPEEAIGSFRRAVTLNSEFAEAHANLGNALRSIGRLAEAVAAYREALRIDPGFAAAHIELATALRLHRKTAESEACCRKALELVPDSAAALLVLAELRADAGDFAAAEDLFRRAASSDAESPEAWAGITRVRRMTRADEPWLTTALRLVERGLAPQRELPLQYSIGKYFDDVADFDAAFAHYRRANELARQCGPAHDRAQLTRTIDLIIQSHGRSWFDAPTAAADPSRRPVFIVGMLRSGTSLAEQILASHPAVFGAGELTFWSEELAATLARTFAAGAAQLQANAARRTSPGRTYLGLLRGLDADAARVVDKLPTNFLALGLIHAALPQARIIHLRRNPIDTCLSIYFQHFEAANTYANDLSDLAHYYGEYRRLMRHWRALLPPQVLLEVPYEGLVADLEGWTRTMLEFTRLPWEPRCLQFHRTVRPVITASKWQVRQGINSNSVQRWRRYAKFAAPLAALLESASD